MEESLAGLASDINTELEAVETAASRGDHVSPGSVEAESPSCPSHAKDMTNELEMESGHRSEDGTTVQYVMDVTSGSPSTLEDGATGIDMSVSVREEDIDPFTYRPQFTKWDYIKVRKTK